MNLLLIATYEKGVITDLILVVILILDIEQEFIQNKKLFQVQDIVMIWILFQ